MVNPHIGSSFDVFLKEEGIYEEVTAVAVKKMLAWQLKQTRVERGVREERAPSRCKRTEGTVGEAANRSLDIRDSCLTSCVPAT